MHNNVFTYFSTLKDGSEFTFESDKQLTTEHATCFYLRDKLVYIVSHSVVETLLIVK